MILPGYNWLEWREESIVVIPRRFINLTEIIYKNISPSSYDLQLKINPFADRWQSISQDIRDSMHQHINKTM